MTKAEIVDKTLESIRQVPIQNLTPFDSEAGFDELVIADLQDRLPHNVDIKTCEDFQYLGVECCLVCHGPYTHYEMFLIGQSDGSVAWACYTVKRAILGAALKGCNVRRPLNLSDTPQNPTL